MKNVFTTYIDVISYKKSATERLGIETEIIEAMKENDFDQGPQMEDVRFTKNEIEEFKEFAKDARCYDKLVDVFAPSIWENDDVKKGVIL